MKIILVDNYGRESVADRLIAENVKEPWSGRIVNALNEQEHDNSENYFRAVADDFKLWCGMEELI